MASFKDVLGRPLPGVKPEIGQGSVGYDAAMSLHTIRLRGELTCVWAESWWAGGDWPCWR